VKVLKTAASAFGLAALLFGASAALTPKPAAAGNGFMGNSVALLKNNPAINTDLQGGVSILEAIAYWIVPLSIVAAGVGIGATRNSNNDEAYKMVKAVCVVWFGILSLLWLYDSKMVPTAGTSTPVTTIPHPVHVAIARGWET
jgi:hypothetical protein